MAVPGGRVLGRAARVFFFSSRRRHTSYIGDWSSDVCSSDLIVSGPVSVICTWEKSAVMSGVRYAFGSEERRVGKECRSGWAPRRDRKDTRGWCGGTRGGAGRRGGSG